MRKYSFNNIQMFCILGILVFFSTIISAIIFATTIKIKGNVNKTQINKNNNNTGNFFVFV